MIGQFSFVRNTNLRIICFDFSKYKHNANAKQWRKKKGYFYIALVLKLSSLCSRSFSAAPPPA